MKIAVLMGGHLRAWDYCKTNFLNTVQDPNHQVDVYVDTYFEQFRSDYRLHNENMMGIVNSEEDIRKMFDDVNLISLIVEPEWGAGLPSQIPHKRKTMRVYNTYLKYQEDNKYDMVFSYRPDILLDAKVDYDYEYSRMQKNPNLVLMANGALNMPGENPFCGLGLAETMNIYFNRLNEWNESDPMLFHSSFTHIKNKYGLIYEQSLHMSVVRLDGNRNYRTEK